MWLPILFTLGFLPPSDPAALPPGPPIPRLAREPGRQASLDVRPRVRAFRGRWGRWFVRWDPRDGTPRVLAGGAVSEADAAAFVADLARLAGVDPAGLVDLGGRRHGDRFSRRYGFTFRGVPVEGARVDLHGRGGRIVYVSLDLHRPRLEGRPLPGEVALPLQDEQGIAWVWATREEDGDAVRFRDRAGRVVLAWSLRRYLDEEVEARTVGDPLVRVPVREVEVSDGLVTELTDDAGLHGLAAPVDVLLAGPHLEVRDAGGEPSSGPLSPVSIPGVDDELLDWDVEIVPAAATVQHHVHVARDWLASRRPDHPWLPDAVIATVRVDGQCNAYYTRGTINFYEEGGDCADFGRIADVVYHEYGHGVHDYILEGGVFAGDVSEGSADYISATILDDPVLAPEATGPGTYIREIETDRVYPEDANGESHNDGLIWASFLWNLRTDWRAAYGGDGGWEMVDRLFLEALSYGPTLTEVTEPVLLADDDDGDLANGTPHDCELIDRLNAHGIGPGPVGLVFLDHTPIEAAASDEEGYPVTFRLEEIGVACDDSGVDPDSPMVFWVRDPRRDATLDDLVLQGVPAARKGDAYEAIIPRQPAGTQVAYAIAYRSRDGTQTVWSHGGSAEGLWRFFVGDREDLWCEDFETGAKDWRFMPGLPDGTIQPGWHSEWEVGAPGGGGYDPDLPWEGAAVLGTDLGPEGAYDPNNGQQAQGPEVDLSMANAHLRVLSVMRWLTVEDARYDQAQVWWVSDDGEAVPLWRNLETEGGSTHTLDGDWTRQDLDLSDLPAGPGRFAWSLRSDGGLEYGGWALDRVCLQTLADVPGHYRVRDLALDGGAEAIRLTWTWPWIEPVAAGRLVRRKGGIPAGPEDGEVVAEWTDLAAGAPAEVEDVPGAGTYGYAVFTAEQAGSWFEEVVEGDNAVLRLPAEAGDTGGPGDTGEPADTGGPGDTGASGGPAAAGCGCNGGVGVPAASWWPLLLGLAALPRRRRP